MNSLKLILTEIALHFEKVQLSAYCLVTILGYKNGIDLFITFFLFYPTSFWIDQTNQKIVIYREPYVIIKNLWIFLNFMNYTRNIIVILRLIQEFVYLAIKSENEYQNFSKWWQGMKKKLLLIEIILLP